MCMANPASESPNRTSCGSAPTRRPRKPRRRRRRDTASDESTGFQHSTRDSERNMFRNEATLLPHLFISLFPPLRFLPMCPI
jgi:hypothetical protein